MLWISPSLEKSRPGRTCVHNLKCDYTRATVRYGGSMVQRPEPRDNTAASPCLHTNFTIDTSGAAFCLPDTRHYEGTSHERCTKRSFYSSFRPCSYHFTRSLTPTATTLAFPNLTPVTKYRESAACFRKRHGGIETLLFCGQGPFLISFSRFSQLII